MSSLFEGLKESIEDAGKFLRGGDVPGLTLQAWEHGDVSSKPVARILQLIEAEPKIMSYLVAEKRKTATPK
jgi:hypothetical protein